jgi:hypothetical protein
MMRVLDSNKTWLSYLFHRLGKTQALFLDTWKIAAISRSPRVQRAPSADEPTWLKGARLRDSTVDELMGMRHE